MQLILNFADRNDAIAVDALVKGWMRRGSDSLVRYYKKIGESNNDTMEGDKSHFTSKDFMLVLQSETQSQIHGENPRILCADSTHGVTGYSFYLLSLLVINRFGVGFIIGWAICSRENSVICYLGDNVAIPSTIVPKDKPGSVYVGRRQRRVERFDEGFPVVIA